MVLEKTLSRRGHERLGSNIHVTNKTVFRPGINMRGVDRAIRVVDTMQDDIRWLGLYEVKRDGNTTMLNAGSKLTVPKCDLALEKEPVEVYFAGSVAPETVIIYCALELS
ncbi:hypothetical protein BDR07DRAFT_1416124 [Suillus spraguei]|nr:hypothetical protein BDR07DRAFT_1416124 [Suillus spraguei]